MHSFGVGRGPAGTPAPGAAGAGSRAREDGPAPRRARECGRGGTIWTLRHGVPTGALPPTKKSPCPSGPRIHAHPVLGPGDSRDLPRPVTWQIPHRKLRKAHTANRQPGLGKKGGIGGGGQSFPDTCFPRVIQGIGTPSVRRSTHSDIAQDQHPTLVIACILIATLCIAFVGLLVLAHGIKKAPVGCEDGHGFHERSAGRRAAALDDDSHAATTGPAGRAREEGFLALRLPTRGLRQ